MTKNLLEIAAKIIEDSEGAYSKEVPDDYNHLSAEDKEEVDSWVSSALAWCSTCGIYDRYYNFYYNFHGYECISCHNESENDGQPDESQEWESYDPDC